MIALWTTGLALWGCTGGDDGFGPGPAPETGTPVTTTTTTTSGTTTATTTATTDTGTAETTVLDEPGDVLPWEGTDPVDLHDESGDSNQDQQFYFVAINPAVSEAGFRLNYATEGAPLPSAPAASGTPAVAGSLPAPTRRVPEDWRPATVLPLPAAYTDADIGQAHEEFNVRNSYQEESFSPVAATLWGLGESVAIWVDDDLPIDWDIDCDGVVDVPADREAYGFDNCDLEAVADIVDLNLVPNLRDLLGDESDINGDGRVSVLITPILNNLPRTSDNPRDWGSIIGSYADPEVDLADYDAFQNPGSDEQEIIYVFAPDPYGLFNPAHPTTVEEYTSQELAGEIALSLARLILYNQHVMVSGGDMEETWLATAIGAVSADICGFGAIFYDDAWEYLDAPHLFALTSTADADQEGFFRSTPMGAEYLFGRYLVDRYGASILATLTQSELVGALNVEAAVGDVTFDDLVVAWQVALLASGAEDESGVALVDPVTWPQYAPATTITAPTTPPSKPSVGVYYGANGYQTGFNVRGTNVYMEGGTTASPVENVARRVVTDGPDFHLQAPGYPLYGYVAPGYGAFWARLDEVPYDAALLDVDANSGDLLGAVVRWTDPVERDFALETVFSPLETDDVPLPALPADGSEILALGEISPASTLDVVEADAQTTQEVPDLDRWILDLTDRPAGGVIQVAVWLQRRYENDQGDVAPFDPWLAIAPIEDVPRAEVGVTASDPTCPDAIPFSYPTTLTPVLFEQLVLKEEAFGQDDDLFDCDGEPSEDPPTCGTDWDGDGVADEDEPLPANFVQQVLVQQCTNQGADGTLDHPADAYSKDWIDMDEVDDDDDFSASMVYNVGGRSGGDGEEALLIAILETGRRYLVVVSGGVGDTGTYQLHARQLL